MDSLYEKVSYFLSPEGLVNYPTVDFYPYRNLAENIKNNYAIVDDLGNIIGFDLGIGDDFTSIQKLMKLDEFKGLIDECWEIDEYMDYVAREVLDPDHPIIEWEDFLARTDDIGDTIIDLENSYDNLKVCIEIDPQADPCDLHSERQITIKEGIAVGAVSITIGMISFIFGLTEIFRLIADYASGEYSGREAEFFMRLAGSTCAALIGVLGITVGTIVFIASFAKNIADGLLNSAKYLGKAIAVLAVLISVFEVGTLIAQFISGDLSDYTFWMELAKIAITVAFDIGIGLAIAATCSETGPWGVVAGLIIAGISLLTGWLTTLLNNPKWTIYTPDMIPEDLQGFLTGTGPIIPASTELNMRRHGSLEVGDIINYHIYAKNTGDRPVWFRANIAAEGGEWAGWQGKFGQWWYNPGESFEADYSITIAKAAPELNLNLKMDMDWEKFEIIIVVPWWQRVTGYRYNENISLGLPVLENSISDFYDNTIKIEEIEKIEINDLIEEFYKAKEEFRYKDAYDTANEIINLRQQELKITVNEYLNIQSRLELNEDNYLLKTNSEEEFQSLVERFYNRGVRAKNPIYFYNIEIPLTSITIPIPIFPPILWDYLAYDESDGYLIIPLSWDNFMNDVFDFINYRDELPLRTNIELSYTTQMQDIDSETGFYSTNFNYQLEGVDDPNVVFEFLAPPEFEITPLSFTGTLSSSIPLTISRVNTSILAGVYYFDFIIKLEDDIIFNQMVPFRMNSFSDLRFELENLTNPIIPGETVYILNITNYGNIPELVYLNISEIDPTFIYEDLYPEEYTDPFVQQHVIYPGQSVPCLIIRPPRNFNTLPGSYPCNITALDPIFGQLIVIDGSFEVGKFYDLEFECTEPEITIYDHEIGNYEFELTNLGNVAQNFNFSYDNISISSELMDSDMLSLNPGQQDSFSLILTPTYWGSEDFNVYINSEYNSSILNAHITIIDDDQNAPILSNLDLINNPLDLTVNFDILNEDEGDDQGISVINIYIDNILCITYNPDSDETSFTFTLSDNWLIEYGTHELMIEVVDNDNDVINDALTTVIIDHFETSPANMMSYILLEINELKLFIDDNVSCPYDFILESQLIRAEVNVESALESFILADVPKSVVLNKLAKANLDMTDFFIYIFNNFNAIPEDITYYIINELHKIRDHITITMGAIIGTECALDTANIIIQIDRLADKIFNDQEFMVSISIDIHLWIASNYLDNALVTMSLDDTTETLILESLSKVNLEFADLMAYLWDNVGCISENDSEYISIQIHKIRDNITFIMGRIVNTELSMKVANIEAEINQFGDLLFNSYDRIITLSINYKLWAISGYLDYILIVLAENCTYSVEMNINQIINQLNLIKLEIEEMENCGILSNEDALEIYDYTDKFINDIEDLTILI